MRVLLTGANSGLGYALLTHFLDKGDEVVAIDRQHSKLEALTESRLTAVEIDLTDNTTLLDWLSKQRQVFDITINCAGIREIESVLTLDYHEWQNVLNVNLTAPFLISQRVARLAVDAGCAANIINIASISGLAAEPNRAAYCASKHGIIGLTREMAMELGEHDIRVNAIAPGIVQTELTDSYFADDDLVQLIKKNTPLRRWGKPRHIVNAVQFVLDNDYMTGSVLVVDGGWTAGKDL